MDAPALASPRWLQVANLSVAMRLAHDVLKVLLVVGLALAGLLAARRVAGALVRPLDLLELAAAGTVAALWRWGADVWIERSGASRRAKALSAAASTAAVLACLVLWLPGTSWSGVALLFAPLAIVEAVRRFKLLRRAVAGVAPVTSLATTSAPSPLDEETVAEDVTQQLTRRRDAAGRETIHGLLRASFSKGQRTAVLHVAFCPPLAGDIQCEAESVEGPPAEVIATQQFAHGVRLEVRLEGPADEACHVLVELLAGPEHAGEHSLS
jgi:hypothetical protein